MCEECAQGNHAQCLAPRGDLVAEGVWVTYCCCGLEIG